MAWIESHQDLRSNPKTKRAARHLETTVPAVMGHLHCLWHWALDHAFDGDVSAFDPEDLADAAEWSGDPHTFVKVLTDCGPGDKAGFLEVDGLTADGEKGLLVLHDWGQFTAHLRERREASRLANHERWHVKRGRPDPECALCCIPADSDGSPDGDGSDDASDPNGVPDGLHRPTDLPEPTDQPNQPSAPDVAEVAHELCRVFVVEHCRPNQHGEPKKGSQAWRDWLIEMDRLVRIGPPNVGKGVEPERIHAVIKGMAVDTGNGDFPGWSKVCESVPTFRKKWTKIAASVEAKSRDGPSKAAQIAATYGAAADEAERRGQ